MDVEQLNIPIHTFDLIIADECHRGYSAKDMSVWRTTLCRRHVKTDPVASPEI
jgi:type I restriction enzyme, R subunit